MADDDAQPGRGIARAHLALSLVSLTCLGVIWTYPGGLDHRPWQRLAVLFALSAGVGFGYYLANIGRDPSSGERAARRNQGDPTQPDIVQFGPPSRSEPTQR